MINFQIDFFANDVNYKAKVHKIPSDDNSPVEFHAFNIQPEIPNAPRTFKFTYNTEEAIFQSTVFNNDVELSQNIFTSIKNHCTENNIPLTT